MPTTKPDTKTAHTATPGPWKLIKRDTTFDIVGADGVDVLKTSWHFAIRARYPLKDEALANARLATAAPELLDAAKALIEAMPSDTLLTDGEIGPLASLRAAIAKAEGSAK